MKEMVIDASGAVLGRLASFAAKQAMLGNNIFIVNCENAIITGRPRKTIDEYRETRTKGGANLQGPYFPKHPERILKRTVRGMLAYKQQRGRDALSRVKCFVGVPEQFVDMKKIHAGKEKRSKSIKLEKLSKRL